MTGTEPTALDECVAQRSRATHQVQAQLGAGSVARNTRLTEIQGDAQADRLAAARIATAANDAETPSEALLEAAERLAFVRMVRALTKDMNLTARDAAAAAAADHAERFPILSRSGHGGGTSLLYNNYRNWSKREREAREAGCRTDSELTRALASRYRRGCREPEGDPRFWMQLWSFWLGRNKLTLTTAYRLAREKMRKEDPTAEIPSFAAARYRARRIPKAEALYAREGAKAWRNKCCDYIERTWDALEPGELLIGDSRTFDTRVRVTDADGRIRAARPTIAALLDARSWVVAGYWLTTEAANADMLTATLGLAILNMGGFAPPEIVFDNGKDYCAQGFSTPLKAGGREWSVFQELGIRLTNATPYNARAKTIERFFRDAMQDFDKLFADYLGSNPGERTDAAAWHDAHPEALPTLDEFGCAWHAWLTAWQRRPKRGRIHKGRSPWEIWSERKESARRRWTPEELRLALLRPVGMRLVGRGPAVTLDKVRYVDESNALEWGSNALVKRDVFDPDRVYAFSPDGVLLAECVRRDALPALIKATCGTDAGVETERMRGLIARQRAQLSRMRGALLDATGGRFGLSPLEIWSAGTEERIALKRLGEKRLVKGAEHVYVRQIAPVCDWTESSQPCCDRDASRRESRQEAATVTAGAASSRRESPSEAGRQIRLAQPGAASVARNTRSTDFQEDEEEIRKFHAFMRTRGSEEEGEDEA